MTDAFVGDFVALKQDWIDKCKIELARLFVRQKWRLCYATTVWANQSLTSSMNISTAGLRSLSHLSFFRITVHSDCIRKMENVCSAEQLSRTILAEIINRTSLSARYCKCFIFRNCIFRLSAIFIYRFGFCNNVCLVINFYYWVLAAYINDNN